jgi:hypothetical protein
MKKILIPAGKVLTGLLALVVLAFAYHQMVVVPKEVRTACNKVALDWVNKRSTSPSFYSISDRDADYKFSYDACFHSHGLQPER